MSASRRNPIVAAVLLALAAVGVWLLTSEAKAPPSHVGTDRAGTATAAAAADTAAPADTPRLALPDVPSPGSAGDDGAGLRWVDLRVADVDTGEAMADVAIEWYHGEGSWHTRSDDRGFARIHLATFTSIEARFGARYGELGIDPDTPPPPGGYLIELGAEFAVRARVVQADGTPAVGLEVLATCRNDHGNRFPDQSATTDESGVATFEHLQSFDRQGDTTRADQEDDAWYLRADVPGPVVRSAPFALRAPPAEVVELRLPPCGRVRARVEVDGRPQPAGLRLTMVRGEEEIGKPMAQLAHDREWTVFPFVPAGASYRLEVFSDAPRLATTFAGPLAAGETRDLVLRPGPEFAIVTGRILDQRGAPLRGALVELDPGWDRAFEHRTDAEGRFLYCATDHRGEPTPPLTGNQLGVIGRDADTSIRRAEVRLPPPNGNRYLCGDLRLARPQTVELLRGWFVVDGRPAGRCYPFDVERAVEGASPDEAPWSRVRFSHCTVDDDGVFHFHAPPQRPGRFRVVVRDDVLLPRDPVEFAVGTTDLAIPVQLAGALTATVLTPPDLPPGLQLRLRRVVDGATIEDRSLAQWIHEVRPGRLQVEWTAVVPGRHRLEVSLFGFDEPRLVVDDLAAPGPPGGDPRLVVDLRPLVETLTVRTRATFGEHSTRNDEGRLVLLPLPADRETPAWAFDLWAGSVRLAVPKRPVDLLVALESFRPRTVLGARGEVTVDVEPWPTAAFVLAPDIALPPGFALEVGLEERTRFQACEVLDGGHSSLDLAPPIEGLTRLGDGPVRIVAADEPRALQVALLHLASGQRRELTRTTPGSAQAGPAPIALRPDAEELRAAAAELSR